MKRKGKGGSALREGSTHLGHAPAAAVGGGREGGGSPQGLGSGVARTLRAGAQALSQRGAAEIRQAAEAAVLDLAAQRRSQRHYCKAAARHAVRGCLHRPRAPRVDQSRPVIPTRERKAAGVCAATAQDIRPWVGIHAIASAELMGAGKPHAAVSHAARAIGRGLRESLLCGLSMTLLHIGLAAGFLGDVCSEECSWRLGNFQITRDRYADAAPGHAQLIPPAQQLGACDDC